jgi:hypothetical protein
MIFIIFSTISFGCFLFQVWFHFHIESWEQKPHMDAVFLYLNFDLNFDLKMLNTKSNLWEVSSG